MFDNEDVRSIGAARNGDDTGALRAEADMGRAPSTSRRKLLAAAGMTGAALLAQGLWGGRAANVYGNEGTVSGSVYGTQSCCGTQPQGAVVAASIAGLRAEMSPHADCIYYVTDPGQEGPFRFDPADTASPDNIGTVLVSTSGARFKRIYEDEVNVKWFGAKGDGAANDWEALQRAFDYVLNGDGGMIRIPAGTYVIVSRSVMVWGSNLRVIGDGQDVTIIKKSGSAGQTGDCFNVAGKVQNSYYYGEFGAGDYAQKLQYTGPTIQSRNINIEGITLDSLLTVPHPQANNMGVSNTDGLIVRDCTFRNALQTNVAIVNDALVSMNGLNRFYNCTFTGSMQHSVRVISYNTGPFVGNMAEFYGCRFHNVMGADTVSREIIGRQAHFYYRGGLLSDQVGAKLIGCHFDSTGSIVTSNRNMNLHILDCTIDNGICLQGSGDSNLVIRGNKFRGIGAKTNFTDEAYLYIRTMNIIKFHDNTLPLAPASGTSLPTLVMAAVKDVSVSGNKNVSLEIGAVTATSVNEGITIVANTFNKPTSESGIHHLRLRGKSIVATGNVFNDTCVFATAALSGAQIVGNRFKLGVDLAGRQIVDGIPGTVTHSVIAHNSCETGTAVSAETMFAPASVYDSCIVDLNEIRFSDGTVTGETVRRPSMPTAGYFARGHRVIHTSPAIAGTAPNHYLLAGWIRITDGSAHTLNVDWVEDRVPI